MAFSSCSSFSIMSRPSIHSLMWDRTSRGQDELVFHTLWRQQTAAIAHQILQKKKKKKIRRHLLKLQISYARPLNGAEAAATHTICKMHYVLVLKKKKGSNLGDFSLWIICSHPAQGGEIRWQIIEEGPSIRYWGLRTIHLWGCTKEILK